MAGAVGPSTPRPTVGARRTHAEHRQTASATGGRFEGGRQRAASSRCSISTASEPARSATVRATRSRRSVPRPESRSESARFDEPPRRDRGACRAIARSARPVIRAFSRPPSRASLPRPRGSDPRGNHGRRLRVRPRDHGRRLHPRERHPDVDPVPERPGDPADVSLRHALRAPAAVVLARVAARAWVRRGDELEARRQRGGPGRAGDRDAPILERLAQRLQHVARELGELVQEQDAAVGAGHLAGDRAATSAHDGRIGAGVVRGSERRRADRARGAGPRRTRTRRSSPRATARRRAAAGAPGSFARASSCRSPAARS